MRPSQTLIPRLAALVRGSHTPAQAFMPAETMMKLGESSTASRTRGWWTVSGEEGISGIAPHAMHNGTQSTGNTSRSMYRDPRSFPPISTSAAKLTHPSPVSSTIHTTAPPPPDKVPPPTLAWCDFLSMV